MPFVKKLPLVKIKPVKDNTFQKKLYKFHNKAFKNPYFHKKFPREPFSNDLLAFLKKKWGDKKNIGLKAKKDIIISKSKSEKKINNPIVDKISTILNKNKSLNKQNYNKFSSENINPKFTWNTSKLNTTKERRPNIQNLELSRRKRKLRNIAIFRNASNWSKFFKEKNLPLEHKSIEHTTVYPYWDFRVVNKFDYNFVNYKWSQGIETAKKYRNYLKIKNITIILKLLANSNIFLNTNTFDNIYKQSPVYFSDNLKTFSFFFFRLLKEKRNYSFFKNFFFFSVFKCFLDKFFFFF